MVRTRSLLLPVAAALGAAGLALGATAVDANGRQHRAAAAGCPSTAPTPAPSPSRPVRGVLVAKGATTVLLCRYHGLNPQATAHHLERARLVTAANRVAQLTAGLDALPQVSGLLHCPMDDGSEITVRFRYPHASAATVDVDLTGCRTVSRGRLVRSAGGPAGTRLIAQLSSLDP